MMRARVLSAMATMCLGGAFVCTPPQVATLREFGSWLVRPAVLPFAWRALEEAQRRGDANEVFARAQQILRWLPSWTDGHAVFAYRFTLTSGERAADPAARAQAALQRLDIALTWLEQARADAGKREPGLLQTMSFLPLVAASCEPGLAELLRPRGGSAGLADHYLAQAEALSGSIAVREQRTYFAPQLVAALLDAGQPATARSVLQTAIERSHDLRDRELATEWRARLLELARWLDGDRSVELSALGADERFQPLLPHLR